MLQFKNEGGFIMDAQETIKLLEAQFGSRETFLAHQLVMLSMSGQPCDITFYDRKPMINVKVDQKIGLALMYGAGEKKIQEIFNRIRFSGGGEASIGEIWTVNPMPCDGISQDELNAADLAAGDEHVGPNGETLREMIKNTYHCTTKEEEDYYLRRFVAS